MKRFSKTYDLTNLSLCSMLMEAVSVTHEAIQQLEAGIEGTEDQKAEATFLFLDLLGFYPSIIEDMGLDHPVVARGLRAVNGNQYVVDFEMENGQVASFPMKGPGGPLTLSVLTADEAIRVTRAAFPKAVIQTTTGTSKSGVKVYHTTVRPSFIQPAGEEGYPIESGSAECSNEAVSVMQATVRMVSAHVLAASAAAVALHAVKLAEGKKQKTAADIGKEKYGNSNWREYAQTFAKEEQDRQAKKKEALATGYGMGVPKTARSQLDDMVKHLKTLGIEVTLIGF